MKLFGTNFMYDLLFTSITFISIVILSLIVLLVINNVYYNWKEKKRKKYYDKYIDIISSYITGEAVEIEKLTDNLEFETFADVCDNTMLDFSGEQAKKVHLLLDRLGVIDFYKKRSQAYSKLTRHNAIEKLGFFKMPALKLFFMDLLKKEPKEKNRVRILLALSFIADWETLHIITDRLTEKLKKQNLVTAKLLEHIYTNIIKAFKDRNMLTQFMDFFAELKNSDKVPVIIKREIINACGALHLKEAVPVLVDFYNNLDDIEIKAAVVRALGRIGAPEGRNVIVNALESDSWILRLVGAKSAGVCGPIAKHNLRTLLSDSHYHVRLNAARALAGLGSEGLAVLRGERNSEDAFTRDTVKYVLDLNVNNVY
jgi:HEAT repeat protein